jgi:hypothetical protein
MSRSRLMAVTASILALASTSALAQHAKFVLFGDKTEINSPAEDRFVHPVTSPYFAEDSFVTTDLRLWYLYHNFDNGSLINGGDAQVFAAQVRIALTNQLQLVAYKDGYVDFDSGLVDDSGWNDVAAGLKWNFLHDWENQLHMAVGVGYEFPVGSPGVFQNDQELRFWYSVNKGFGPFHLGGTANYQLALGDDDQVPLGNADQFSWHLHADYYINQYVSPVLEINGYHVVNRGEEVVPFSGIDVANFGGGGDVISAAAGVEVRPIENVGVRAAYELPLTSDDDDLFGWRLTFSVVLSF